MRLRAYLPILALFVLVAQTPPLAGQEWTPVTPEAGEAPVAPVAPARPVDIQGPDEVGPVIFLRGAEDGLFQMEPVAAWGGYLGVAVSDLTPELREHFGLPEDRGVLVARVEPDSPAATGGLFVGDFLLTVDGEPVADGRELSRSVARQEPGTEVDVEVQREDRVLDFRVELAERPRLQVDLGRALAHPGMPRLDIHVPEAVRHLEGLDVHTIDIDPERFEAVIREFREGLAPEVEDRVRAYSERNRELESRLQELESRLLELEKSLEGMAGGG